MVQGSGCVVEGWEELVRKNLRKEDLLEERVFFDGTVWRESVGRQECLASKP